MKNKYFNFEKSFISVLSIKCLRYCALSGSFRCLEGENAKEDPLCLIVTTVGGLLLNQRFRDHATTWLHRKRNWCRNPENTAETAHSRWALLEVCWYPGHHDGSIGVTRNVQRVIQTKVASSRFSVNDAVLRDHDEDLNQKSVQNISQKTKQEKHTKHNTR